MPINSVVLFSLLLHRVHFWLCLSQLYWLFCPTWWLESVKLLIESLMRDRFNTKTEPLHDNMNILKICSLRELSIITIKRANNYYYRHVYVCTFSIRFISQSYEMTFVSILNLEAFFVSPVYWEPFCIYGSKLRKLWISQCVIPVIRHVFLKQI